RRGARAPFEGLAPSGPLPLGKGGPERPRAKRGGVEGPGEGADRGRAIYHHGTGSSLITATLGADGAARIDAAAVPCASCHGADGRGKPEGGVRPSDLRHAMLTKPYEVAAAGGRRRG